MRRDSAASSSVYNISRNLVLARCSRRHHRHMPALLPNKACLSDPQPEPPQRTATTTVTAGSCQTDMSSYAEPIPAMSHRSQLHCLNNNNTLPFHSHTMGPRVDLPVNKMPPVNRTPSRASDDGVRKRVGKACDRCRLKKSKCDGFSFCSRCKADNAICVFGYVRKLLLIKRAIRLTILQGPQKIPG